MRVLITLMLACLPVRAEEEMEFDVDIDTKLVCDTQKQVERFVALFTGDVGAALHAVNSEQENPTACDVASIAYVPGDEVSNAKGPCGHFRVVRILLIGVLNRGQRFSFHGAGAVFLDAARGQKYQPFARTPQRQPRCCRQRNARSTSHRNRRQAGKRFETIHNAILEGSVMTNPIEQSCTRYAPKSGAGRHLSPRCRMLKTPRSLSARCTNCAAI